MQIIDKLQKLAHSQECECMINHLQDTDELKRQWDNNPLLKIWASQEHTAGQDNIAGIQELATQILEPRRPSHIGPSLVRRFNTTREVTKVRVPTVGKAVKTGSGKVSISSQGERNTFLELKPDTEFESSDEWDLNFLESAEWNVVSALTADIGLNLREIVSQFIINKMQSVTTAQSAGLVTLGSSASLTPDMLIEAWGKVLIQNGDANTLVMHPTQAVQLFQNSDMKNQLILGQFADYTQGMLGMFLGMQIYMSTQVTAGQAYAFDRTRFMYGIWRRDMLMTPYSPKVHTHGLQASSKLGVTFADTKVCSPIRGA